MRRRTHRSIESWIRRVAALVCVALAAACSTLRLSYNNADTLLVLALDRYFDLDDAQRQLVRDSARALLAWHRADQLPAYVEFLERISQRVGQRAEVDDVLRFYEQANAWLLVLGERAAPSAARLALTLTPAQIARCEQQLARDNAKAHRVLTADGRRDVLEGRVQRTVERVADWLGSVTKEQQQLIRRSVEQWSREHSWWMEEKERRQRELLALLRRIQQEQPPVEQAARWLAAYVAHVAQPLEAQRQAQLARARRANAELVALMLNHATPAQHAVLLKRLRSYADELAALAAAGARG
ncbi:MAG: DUF6279 family lipoprotein [Sutterellaceae bacterium]|nr:DUF6279 family lipoprotein [Burkholderiaceae bacterium]MCX7900694.1 DUF6279 family lipoprotein [Burkholderiaceae bacterium]MDW8429710.1 DUF6279 family lipoprotein [Sutterellaceae bacterium]